MYTITKNARIHESVASDKFSVAERSSMRKEAGTNYFAFPFSTEIVGCGDSAPTDYDQNGRTRFARDEAYTPEDLAADIVVLCERRGLKTVVNGLNRGLDLELRSEARPTPKSKMSDADKALWVMSNNKEVALEAVGKPDAAKILARWFDENPPTA